MNVNTHNNRANEAIWSTFDSNSIAHCWSSLFIQRIIKSAISFIKGKKRARKNNESSSKRKGEFQDIPKGQDNGKRKRELINQYSYEQNRLYEEYINSRKTSKEQVNKLSKLLSSEYASGTVDNIPQLDKYVYITDGWQCKTMLSDDNQTILSCKVNSSKSLPFHHHIQSEKVIMHSGKCLLYLIEENSIQPCQLETYKLEAGDTLYIPSKIIHAAFSLNKCEMSVTFKPSITPYEHYRS